MNKLLFWFITIPLFSWGTEKQQKITYYFKYDKVSKKNKVVTKFPSGAYTINEKLVVDQLPKPPLRREMVIRDIRAYMEQFKKSNDNYTQKSTEKKDKDSGK